LRWLVFQFEAQDPIEVESLAGEEFLKVFAAGGIELGNHFAFLHVEQDAARARGFRADEKSGQTFGALSREARQTVLG
jgi:hypothetical protein